MIKNPTSIIQQIAAVRRCQGARLGGISQMTRRRLKAAIVPALLLAAASFCSVPASAADIDFCKGATSCKNGQVDNGSMALVTKVVVNQMNEGGCVPFTKTYSQDMANGSSGFSIGMKPECTYKVTYKTTKGCMGHKDTKITPADIESGKTKLLLQGLCGSLRIDQYGSK